MYNNSMNILQEFDTIAAIATPLGMGFIFNLKYLL